MPHVPGRGAPARPSRLHAPRARRTPGADGARGAGARAVRGLRSGCTPRHAARAVAARRRPGAASRNGRDDKRRQRGVFAVWRRTVCSLPVSVSVRVPVQIHMWKSKPET